MKPKLNDIIYAIDDIENIQIFIDTALYLGKDDFITSGHCHKKYADYNKTWFKDLEKAKKKIMTINKQFLKENRAKNCRFEFYPKAIGGEMYSLKYEMEE